jgi:hypothetical protein
MMRARLKFFGVFFAASMLLAGAAYGGSMWFVNKMMRERIVESTIAANATITRLFSNQLWPLISPFLDVEMNSAQPKNHQRSEMRWVDQTIRDFAAGTDILKMSVLSVDGRVLYSSEMGDYSGHHNMVDDIAVAASGGISGDYILE